MQQSQEIKPRFRPKLSGRGLTFTLLGMFIIAALGTALLTFAIVRDVVASWGTGAIPEFETNQTEALQASLPKAIASQGNLPLQDVNGPPPMPWDGDRPISVLVMGLDYRDWETSEGAPRTDTMILLSLDPGNRTAGMLSIPRDLWVKIPGFESNKINTAYRLGEIYKVKGGGAGLAMRSAQSLLGMNIDYYALVDFAAFERFIDEIGGVKVDVPAETLIDPLGRNCPGLCNPGAGVAGGPGAGVRPGARQRRRRLRPGRAPAAGYHGHPQPATRPARTAGLNPESSDPVFNTRLWCAHQPDSVPGDPASLAGRQVPEENIKRAMIGPNQATFSNAEDGQEILVPVRKQSSH